MLSQRQPVRGFLCSVGLDPEILVRFQFNPGQITDRRAVSYATVNAPGGLMPQLHYTQGGERTLSFNVRIDGLFSGPAEESVPIARGDDGSIVPELNKYRAFLYPETEDWEEAQASFVPIYTDLQHFRSPPTCRLGLGERVIPCVVTDVSITETLFNSELEPIRAEVSVSLAERPPYGERGAVGVGGS